MIDLRLIKFVCDGSENCFFKKISEITRPSNIKEIWERHSNSLEKTLVGRKDLNVPYEIIKCIEIFTFGYFQNRGFGGNQINERMCLRYSDKSAPVPCPIRVLLITSCGCEGVDVPWVEFLY